MTKLHDSAAPVFDTGFIDSTAFSISSRGSVAVIRIEPFDDGSTWSALQADGTTPSTDLVPAPDTQRAAPTSTKSLRITSSGAASGHLLRQTIAAVDLRNYDELRVWVFSNRPADGSPLKPFFLELRLGSATLAIDDPANAWNRFLPVSGTGGWELVRLSIRDLDPAVRSAVSRLQLRCTASAPFVCHLDELIAVRDEMIVDVDAALIGRLGNLTVNGKAAPAVLHPANGPLNQVRPYIEITNFDVVFSGERTPSTDVRVDFSSDGYGVRGAHFAYDLYYEIACVADDRASQAAMLEFVIRTLRPRGDLLVNGYALPMESLVVPPRERIGGNRTDRIPIHYKIAARQDVSESEAVRPVRTISVGTEMKV